MSNERSVNSVIGSHDNLNRFIETMKKMGNVVNMTFKKAEYQKQDILSVLTEKQRKILVTANKYGYYDYPKKINSEQLSEKVNISKSTLIQHLRKAKGRLIKNIVAGYQSRWVKT